MLCGKSLLLRRKSKILCGKLLFSCRNKQSPHGKIAFPRHKLLGFRDLTRVRDLRIEEWIDNTDGAVKPVVLKIFGKYFFDSIVFRI